MAGSFIFRRMNVYALYDNSMCIEQSVWHDNDAHDYGDVDDDDTAATSWAIKKSFLLCNFFWDWKEFLLSVSLYIVVKWRSRAVYTYVI